jgi:hypothetical protein
MNIKIFFLNINWNIFVINVILFSLIFIPSIIAAGAEDEGMDVNGIWQMFLGFFTILRFPTHTLFWIIFSSNNIFYFIGFLINFSFYSLLIESLVYYLKYYKSK